MATLIKVEARAGFVLYVEFSGGLAGEVNLAARVFSPVFEPLRDEAYLQRVTLDPFGAPCWPNGADLAPDGLHRQLRAQRDAA
jgi:hypothetical protein